MRAERDVSIRRACRIIGISCSVYRYRPDPHRDEEVIAALQEAVENYPAYGFSKLFKILRRRGYGFNHKRVHRVYGLLNLNKRRRGKKRIPNRERVNLEVPAVVNQCWSIDFMSDALYGSHRFRTFNVIDDFNREVLAIEIDLNLPSQRIARVLERTAAWRGYPDMRIAIIEDESLVALGIQGMLEENGHEVVTMATRGAMAAELILLHKPDVVLLDINLKGDGLDGLDVCRLAIEMTKTKVVIITAYSDPETQQRALEAGADEYQ